MNFERFESWAKRNKWTSIILIGLFIVTTAFSVSDYSARVLNLAKALVGYEEPVFVAANGNGAMEKRLNLAKLESVNYKIPSSSAAVVKFLSLPVLNDFNTNSVQTHPHSTHAIVATVSPIKSVSSDYIFDGADCRFGIEVSVFEKDSMIARLEVKSVSCTDNEGYAYSFEPQKSIGFVSEMGRPGIPFIDVIDDDGYLTIDPDKNYFVQLYEPIESIDKRGISLFGRF